MGSLLYGVCETLENMGVMEVLHDSGFKMAKGIWPIEVVVTSIGCGVLFHGFFTISTWVKCPMLCGVLRFRPVVVMRM